MKDVQDPYTENYEHLLKEINQDLNEDIYTHIYIILVNYKFKVLNM